MSKIESDYFIIHGVDKISHFVNTMYNEIVLGLPL